jgi:hypothetical protein
MIMEWQDNHPKLNSKDLNLELSQLNNFIIMAAG